MHEHPKAQLVVGDVRRYDVQIYDIDDFFF